MKKLNQLGTNFQGVFYFGKANSTYDQNRSPFGIIVEKRIRKHTEAAVVTMINSPWKSMEMEPEKRDF